MLNKVITQRLLRILLLVVLLALQSPVSFALGEDTKEGNRGNVSFRSASLSLIAKAPTNKIAAGSYHSLALKPDGTVVAWGANDYGQIDVPEGLTEVVSVLAYENTSMAIKSDGTVVTWGEPRYYMADVWLSDVVAVSLGYEHALALTTDGRVMAWGYNGFGMNDIPEGLDQVVAIADGMTQSLALKADGTLVVWGLGNGVPNGLPEGLTNVVAVAVYRDGFIALKADGTVEPFGLSDVVAIAASDSRALALKSDGAVVTLITYWENDDVPAGLDGVSAIATGQFHSLALKADGTVVAWGNSNSSGQLDVPAGLNLNPPVTDIDIVTSSLPTGTVGSPFIVTLDANGGTTPYTWSAGPDELPPGLNLSGDGTISGTPTTAGVYLINVTVTDSAEMSTSKTLTITVNSPGVSAIVKHYGRPVAGNVGLAVYDLNQDGIIDLYDLVQAARQGRL